MVMIGLPLKWRCWLGVVVMVCAGTTDGWAESIIGDQPSRQRLELREANQGTNPAPAPPDVEEEGKRWKRMRDELAEKEQTGERDLEEQRAKMGQQLVDLKAQAQEEVSRYSKEKMRAILKADEKARAEVRERTKEAVHANLLVATENLATTLRETHQALTLAEEFSAINLELYQRSAEQRTNETNEFVAKAVAKRVPRTDTTTLLDTYRAILTTRAVPRPAEAYCKTLSPDIQRVFKAQARDDTRNQTGLLKAEMSKYVQSQMMKDLQSAVDAKISEIVANTTETVLRANVKLMSDQTIEAMIIRNQQKVSGGAEKGRIADELKWTWEHLVKDPEFAKENVREKVQTATVAAVSTSLTQMYTAAFEARARSDITYQMKLAKPLLDKREKQVYLSNCNNYHTAIKKATGNAHPLYGGEEDEPSTKAERDAAAAQFAGPGNATNPEANEGVELLDELLFSRMQRDSLS